MAFLVNDGARLSLPAHCLIGRSSTCVVRLHAPQVSSEHARLSFREGSWIVRDLSSKNGTYVNGERLEPGSTRASNAAKAVRAGRAEAAAAGFRPRPSARSHPTAAPAWRTSTVPSASI